MNVAEIGTRFTGDLRPLRRAFQEAAELGNRYGQEVKAMSGHMQFFAATVRRATALVGVAGLGAALQLAATEARGFGRAMAEVQTVAGDASQMEALTDSVRELALEFGSAPTAQAKALYEILSAGTSDAAAATDVLTQANRLAMGGVTDVKTAADGLTSALNAYGAAAGGAAAVSDSFFVAAAQGKTTIAELSTYIGKVAPIAASLKIPLDEVTAAIAALTKGGISTGPAVAGLAQVMSSVIKPSKQAAEAAEKLGLEFNAAAITAKGLPGFLADVAEKTKGDATAMGLLFGGVEALVPALSLATTGAESFAGAIEAMENKTGSTQKAVDVMAATMDARINKLQARASAAMVRLGASILNAVVPAAEAIANNLVPILEAGAQAAILLASVVGARLVAAFLKSTSSKIADFIATQAALRANARFTTALVAQTQANVKSATAELNAARARGTGTAAIEAQRAALVRLQTATVQARAAVVANTAAVNAASLSARLAAGSMNLFKGALAFFGGPIGLAITVALAAVGYAFYNTGRKAREAAREAKQAAEDFRAALAGMDDAAATATFFTSFESAASIREQIRSIEGMMDAQRAEIARLEGLGVSMPTVNVLTGTTLAMTDQQRIMLRNARGLEHNRRSLENLTEQEKKFADQVAAASDELANRRRMMEQMGGAFPETPTPPDLGLDDDEAKKGRTYAELLRERASILTQIFELERTQGRESASIMGALNRIYEDATSRLRAMGDAARLSPEALQDYQRLQSIISDLPSSGALTFVNIAQGFGERMDAVMTRVKTLAETEVRPILIRTAEAFARRMEAIKEISLSGVLRVPASAERLDRAGDKLRAAMKEGAEAAARSLTEASEQVRGLWGGLIDGVPEQLNRFASMFTAIQEKHVAQRASDRSVSGLAAFPGAVAFMLAAEALAPVMKALIVPFTALLVPVQMAAVAFGPLLTGVIRALFPIFKTLGVAITYVAQIAGYVSGALLKVVGEIIRTVGSLIAKIPGLGEEGAAIKKFGKGLTDASREMFEMAKAMPGVRDELRNLDWDEAMKRAAESANELADSLTNVPEIFDLIARRTQAMRGTTPSTVGYSRLNVTAASAPSAPSLATAPPYVQQHEVTVNIHEGAFVVNGGDPRQVEGQLRRFKDELIRDLRMPGLSPLRAAVRTATASAY